MKSIASTIVGATIAIASVLLTYRIRKSPRPPKEPKERKS